MMMRSILRTVTAKIYSREHRPRQLKSSAFLSASSITSMYLSTSGSPSVCSDSAMKDEYGSLGDSGETFQTKNFQLESGEILELAQVRYNVYGELNERKDNLLVVCHALTGNANLDQWWGALLGPGKPFDTSKYMVVCANILGSCYGSSGPRSINPSSGRPYGNSFPKVTIRDSVRLHMLMVKEGIGAKSVACVVGGSLGGMQALEWAMLGSEGKGASTSDSEKAFVRSSVVIGCGAAHTAWQIGISETQRQAIYADPKWNNGEVDFSDPPKAGLSVARQIAMISYRTAKGYQNKFGRSKDSNGEWQTKKYLEYQGEKFLSRFDAVTYVKLTEIMDTHDLSRGRVSGEVPTANAKENVEDSEATLRRVLSKLKIPILIMGIDSDILYPLHEQQQLARLLPNSELVVIESIDGHDGFLLEQSQVGDAVSSFLRRHELK